MLDYHTPCSVHAGHWKLGHTAYLFLGTQVCVSHAHLCAAGLGCASFGHTGMCLARSPVRCWFGMCYFECMPTSVLLVWDVLFSVHAHLCAAGLGCAILSARLPVCCSMVDILLLLPLLYLRLSNCTIKYIMLLSFKSDIVQTYNWS